MRGRADSKKHDPKTASRPPWVDDFEDAIDSVSGARNRSDMLNRLLSAWKPLRDGLEEDVSTLDAAQETIGEGPPFVRNCIWDVLNGYRGLLSSSQDSTRARQAAEFVVELLDVFDGESERVESQWLSERAFFLHKAGDTGSAMALCEEIIADYPTRACGYCTLSDIHESTEPPRYKEALDVLRRAQNAPVDDGDDWDLAARIAWLQDTLEEQSWRESEHFVEWSEFFDTFDQAELDKKLDMARDRVENAPDFDGEWAFQLMVEGVRPSCIEQRRGADWLDLLDLLREQRPDIALQESGYLANSGLGFGLDGAPERVAPLVDMLFARPVENIDFIFRNVEVLANRGWSPVHRHLIDAWDAVGKSRHLTTLQIRAPERFVDYTLWPLYEEYRSVLYEHLNAVTNHVVAQVFDDVEQPEKLEG